MFVPICVFCQCLLVSPFRFLALRLSLFAPCLSFSLLFLKLRLLCGSFSPFIILCFPLVLSICFSLLPLISRRPVEPQMLAGSWQLVRSPHPLTTPPPVAHNPHTQPSSAAEAPCVKPPGSCLQASLG